MENIFSFKRFWLLVRKHANENWKLFLLLIIFMIVPSLLYTLLYGRSRVDMFYPFYIFFLVLTGTISTGMFFKNWMHQSRATTLLILPSTPFEKIALVLFYTILVILPVFTFVFYFSNLVLYTSGYPGKPFSMISFYDDHSLIYAIIFRIIIPYAFSQSFFLLCTTWFKKRQIVTGLASSVMILIAVNIWNFSFIKSLTAGMSFFPVNQFLLFPSSVQYHLQGNSQNISSNLIYTISLLVYVIMTVLFFMAAYFKLKEKEI